MKEKVKDKRREDREKREDKKREEARQEKRQDEEREDEREKGRQDEEKMKGRMKEKMKRREKKEKMTFFSKKNVSRPSNPPDELAQNVSKKNPRRTNYSSIFLQMFRIWPFFHLFTWFEFDFSGRGN